LLFFFRPIINILSFLPDIELPRKNVDLHISDIDGEVPVGWPLTLTTVTEVPDQQSAHADECEEVRDSGTTNVDEITNTHPGGGHVDTDERDTSTGSDAAAEGSSNEGRAKTSSGRVRQSVENVENPQEDSDPKQIRDDTMGREDSPARNSQVIETQADDLVGLLDHDRFSGATANNPIGQPAEALLYSNFLDGFRVHSGLVDPLQSHAGTIFPSPL
jgi:hypothetical protein